jgi:uncharacterized membrane protein
MKLPSSDRLEIFSDGVIAIAITLLVLDIQVPHAKSGQLLDALATRWPTYVAYVLSFAVIGLMWISHHSMFERILCVDRGLMFLNLLLLLGIAFVPFPTALLAEYAKDGGSNAHVAAAIYSATMVVIGLSFTAIWAHLAAHHDLVVEGTSPVNLRRSMRRSLVGPVVYAATIGLAFLSAVACFVVYAAITVYFALGPSARALRLGPAVAADEGAAAGSATPVEPPS